MIAALIRFALIQRLMMLLVAASVIAGGLWAFRTLPIDAFPDIYTPQVQVIVKAPGMTPAEVESRITFPIEIEMQGLPGQTALRSLNKYALGLVTVWFEDGTDIYLARQQVAERLNQVRGGLPPGIEPVLAPITTPLGEVYMYRIEGGNLSSWCSMAWDSTKSSRRSRRATATPAATASTGKTRRCWCVPWVYCADWTISARWLWRRVPACRCSSATWPRCAWDRSSAPAV